MTEVEAVARRTLTRHALKRDRRAHMEEHRGVVQETIRDGPIRSVDDYFARTHSRAEFRKRSIGLKDRAEQYNNLTADIKGEDVPDRARYRRHGGGLSDYASLHHGVIEQTRVRGFKRALMNVDPSKHTKRRLKEHAAGLITDYQRASTALAQADPAVTHTQAVKVAKHLDNNLNRRHSMLKYAAMSWLGTRRKNNGDRSLHSALKDVKLAKKEASARVADGMMFGARDQYGAEESSVYGQ